MTIPTPLRVLLCVCLAVVAGCSDDDGTTDPGSLLLFPPPPSPADLMTEFRAAYADMDSAAYAEGLHADFRFVFANLSVWDRATDLSSIGTMFSRAPGNTPDGTGGPGLRTVEFDTLIALGPWITLPSDHPMFPDDERAEFHATIRFILDDATTLTVDSNQIFYVRYEDEGETPRYVLVGQQDPVDAAHRLGTTSWGDIKQFFLQEN